MTWARTPHLKLAYLGVGIEGLLVLAFEEALLPASLIQEQLFSALCVSKLAFHGNRAFVSIRKRPRKLLLHCAFCQHRPMVTGPQIATLPHLQSIPVGHGMQSMLCIATLGCTLVARR
jgi:hypothetical protein